VSNQGLRALLDRINTDAVFRAALQSGEARALLDPYDLSATELVALLSYDEDALRRLAGPDEVQGYLGPVGSPQLYGGASRFMCCPTTQVDVAYARGVVYQLYSMECPALPPGPKRS
jgi:hypothetical protein